MVASLRASTWSVLTLLLLFGCGARTDLGGPGEPARPGRDAGAPLDGGGSPGTCPRLRMVGAPIVVSDEEGLTRAKLVARGGGFDVVVGDRVPDSWIYLVRRLTVRGDALELGVEGTIGPEPRGAGALAADGDRLAFCYGARDLEGPTRFVRTDALDYATFARSTLGTGGGDHCYGLAGAGGRWFAAWNERSASPFVHAVAELDDRGGIVGELTPVEGPILDVVATPGAFVYVWRNELDRAEVFVVTRPPAGPERSVSLRNETGFLVDEVDVVASPFAPGALEVGWRDVEGVSRLSRLDASGVATELSLAGPTAIATGPELARFDGRIAVVTTGCDGEVEEPGRMSLWLRDASALWVPLQLERPACPTSPRAAVDEGDLVLVWQEADASLAALFRCGR